jgi:hypothetical protein
MEIKKLQKVANLFCCKKCDYNTSRKSSYVKHLSTRKHDLEINGNKKLQKVANSVFFCEICEKEYTNSSGLWKHQKKCQPKNYDDTVGQHCNSSQVIVKTDETTKSLTELIMKVVEQNQELTKQIVELSKNNASINNASINNGTINNKFNINIFLNEKCKDAINISDFVSSLVVNVNDLEETTRLGYSEGISKIFINGLKNLDVHNRPVHCRDLKREILYIKDNNEWTKDTDDKAVLTKAIKNVAHKNIKQISEWQKMNPEYSNPDSSQNDKYQKILCNAMSGSTQEESDTNYDKIIKNIAKETVIDKFISN